MIWQLAIIDDYLVNILTTSRFFIRYDGFHWIRIGTPQTMQMLVYALFAAAAGVAAGLWYRLNIIILFTGWTYIFLLCRGHYNNHYYLFCLILFLLCLMNADRAFSLRSRFSKNRIARTIPAWQLYALRAQIIVVYFYGGIAKLNWDWLQGYPLKIWIERKMHVPVMGALLSNDRISHDFIAIFMSYGGLIFDLVIGFVLLSKRFRVWALPFLLFFHISNHFLWTIGTFPWFMIAATGLFFDPDWPDRLLGVQPNREMSAAAAGSRLPIALLTIYFAWQLIFPLRAFAYAGNPAWHGQGHLFAWRMLLVNRGDALRVRVALPDQGTIGYIDPAQYVNRRQFIRMTRTPKSFCHFAHFINDEVEERTGRNDARVYVELRRQLNGRPLRPVIDPDYDLAANPCPVAGSLPFVVPLDPTLRPGTAAPVHRDTADELMVIP